MSESWKKHKGEAAMLEYEKKQIEKFKELWKNRIPERDLRIELINKGFTQEQVSLILDWTETLPIRIYHKNTTVKIEQGIVRVWDNSNEK